MEKYVFLNNILFGKKCNNCLYLFDISSNAPYNNSESIIYQLFCLATKSSPQFVEACVASAARISATVHIRNVSVDIHSGADEETTAMLLRILQSC